MGYIFLGVALLAGATKGYCGKKMGSFTANTQSAVLINIIRMSLCAVFGAILILINQNMGYVTADLKLLLISLVSGVSTSVFVVTWLLAVKKSAYMMVDVFLTLGSLVPMVICFFTFGEPISVQQWIGYAILIAATLIMCSYNNSIKMKMSISSLAFLIICGFSNGVTDFSQKWFVKEFPQTPASVFNLYTYIFAALTLVICYTVMTRKEKPKFEEGANHPYIYVFIMAVMLITNSLFKTRAAVYLDSAQLYPLNQGMALILSSLMASVFFKEKLTVKCITGMGLTFIGLLIMNGVI